MDMITVNSEGYILFDKDNQESTVDKIVKAFTSRYRISSLIIGAETEDLLSNSTVNLFSQQIKAACEDVLFVTNPVNEFIIASLADTHFGFGFYFRKETTNENAPILSLVAYNQQGFALSSAEINAILVISEETKCEKIPTKSSFKIFNNGTVNIYNLLVDKFTAMMYTPALNTIQYSNISFALLTPVKHLHDYIKVSADYLSITLRVSVENNEHVASLEKKLNEKCTEHYMQNLINKELNKHLVSDCDLSFYISKDGQRMVVGNVKANSLIVIPDEDVALVLAWWAILRLQFELEYKRQKLEMELNECPMSQSRSMSLQQQRQLLEPKIKGKILVNKKFSLIEKLAKRHKIDVETVDSEQILKLVRKSMEDNSGNADSPQEKIIFVYDDNRRFILGEKSWDAVATSIQLMQVAILANAIQRISLTDLIEQIKLKLQNFKL